MALRTDYTTLSGEYKENQYIKVSEVVCDKTKIQVTISHSIGQTEPSYEDVLIEIPHDLDGPNPLKQSYEYIKRYVYTTSTDV